MAIIAVGVFTTFSRTSILAALLFFAAVILMRVETKNAVRILLAAVAIPVLVSFFRHRGLSKYQSVSRCHDPNLLVN